MLLVAFLLLVASFRLLVPNSFLLLVWPGALLVAVLNTNMTGTSRDRSTGPYPMSANRTVRLPSGTTVPSSFIETFDYIIEMDLIHSF